MSVEAYKVFLERLRRLSENTGVFIETFGDNYYDPKLTFEGEEPVYLSVDGDKYVIKQGNPYDGEIIHEA